MNASSVLFRLFPGPPTNVSLLATSHEGHPLVRPAEDSTVERVERSRRIRAPGVVIDVDDIVRQGEAQGVSPRPTHCEAGPLDHVPLVLAKGQ